MSAMPDWDVGLWQLWGSIPDVESRAFDFSDT